MTTYPRAPLFPLTSDEGREAVPGPVWDEQLRIFIGVVMKNSGGSANPAVVEKVIRALQGERVSFVETSRRDKPGR